MFDDIRCKYQLPQPKDSKGYVGSFDFQTKDLDNCLDVYEIREDGSFWKENLVTKISPDKKNIFGLPAVEIESVSWTPENFTQTIFIYDYQHSEGEFDYYIEYQLTVIDGKILKSSIKRFDANDNSNRKANDLKVRNDIEKFNVFSKTPAYRYFYRPKQRVVHWAFRKITFGLNALLKLSYRIERFLE